MVDPHEDSLELSSSRYVEWSEHFAAERERLHEALQSHGLMDAVCRIEHVGSTAVPGLAAKDIVDVDVVVADSHVDDVARAIESSLGGDRYENSETWHPIFRLHDGQRFNVHVFAAAEKKWRISVVTRDVLRAHDDLREAYERRKRELAREHDELVAYSRGKTDFVERLLQRARTDEQLTFDIAIPADP